jgi:hypothetical protein
MPSCLHISAEGEMSVVLSDVRIRCGVPSPFDRNGREILWSMITEKLFIKDIIAGFGRLIRLSQVMSVC